MTESQAKVIQEHAVNSKGEDAVDTDDIDWKKTAVELATGIMILQSALESIESVIRPHTGSRG